MPTGPRWFPRPRRQRLVALLAFRDEMRYLPGYLRNVGPQVDGIIALDDGSTDGSAELLVRSPHVLSVLPVTPGRVEWDEIGNYRRLAAAALDLGASWAVSIDADERVEGEFRARAERAIARGRPFGVSAFSIRMRELWGSPDHYRCDGIWGKKACERMFALHPEQSFGDAGLHGSKVPSQSMQRSRVPLADLEVYHLRMIEPADRLARRARYERLDPEARWQPRIGYSYLTDERGLELSAIPKHRSYVD